MKKNHNLKSSKRIFPSQIKGGESTAALVENYFESYNASRLRECCELLAKKILASDNVTVGISLAGALTPAGMGIHSIIPLMKAGFIDWISTTGANLYHDTHFALDCPMYRGGIHNDDSALRRAGTTRIYDILFSYDVLLNTDKFYQKVFEAPEFRDEMTTPELHYRIGKYVAGMEEKLGLKDTSVLAAAWRLGIPIFAPSPGDSSIGMNMAKSALDGLPVRLNVPGDINEAAAIVLDAKRGGGKSAVIILGGGAPKNFLLQTEPQIQEILGIKEKGHDYFIQITDARPDTGGLSGATPSEAVTWGKVDPDMLPDAVVCYTDTSIALPIMASYVLSKVKKRKHKRLYDRRAAMLELLRGEYFKARKMRGKKSGGKK